MRGIILKKNIPSKNCRFFFNKTSSTLRNYRRIEYASLTVLRQSDLYDLDMKTPEQNRNNKRTKKERFDWFIELIQTRMAFGWLRERSGGKTSCPRTF